VIAIGIFDRIAGRYFCQLLICDLLTNGIDDHVLMDLPELYKYGRERRWYGIKWFFVYMLEGLYQVCYKLPFDLH